MIVTDYYKFEKIALLSGTRMDCVASTKSYPEFEDKRKTKGNKQTTMKDANYIGGLTCYYCNVPEHYGKNTKKWQKNLAECKAKVYEIFYDGTME